jgi:YidC/Oxa1 family membrane protein insertase
VTIAPLRETSLVPTSAPGDDHVLESPTVAVALPDGRAQLFAGPKSFGRLAGLDHQLERVVWFSSYSLIYACAKPLFLALRWVHDTWVSNYGVAIILLTSVCACCSSRSTSSRWSRCARWRATCSASSQAQSAPGQVQEEDRCRRASRAQQGDDGAVPARRDQSLRGGDGLLAALHPDADPVAFFDVLSAAVELRGAPFAGWIKDLTHPIRSTSPRF